MIPIGTLPIVWKNEVDGTGTEIGAAKSRIDPEFLSFGHGFVASKIKPADKSDFPQFPNP
jgi:hypothetical protein